MMRTAKLRLVGADEIATAQGEGPLLRAGTLRKLLLCCVGDGERHGPAEAEDLARRLGHHWEWLDGAVVAPGPCALAAARVLRGAVDVDGRLAARGDEPPAPDALAAVLTALAWRGRRGVLLLVEAPVFAAIWRRMTGSAPAARVRFGTIGMLTRAHASWMPGRRSSDPPALRSPLERDGLAELAQLEDEPARHVAPLQLAGSC